MNRKHIYAALLAAAVTGWCAAEEPATAPEAKKAEEKAPIQMEQVVVTARGTQQAISQTPGGVGLVEQQYLFETQPISLSDAATRIPGVSVSKDGFWGGELNIRGLDRGRIVFLIDGQRIITATDVAAQFGLLQPEEIERIEVLKGPISELYGTGSLGGVVNVITKGAKFTDEAEKHGGLTLSASSNPDGFSSHAWTSYSQNDFWGYISGGYRDFNSYKDGSHDEVKNSYFTDYQGTFKAGYKWDDQNVTEVKYSRYHATDVGLPGGSNLPAISQRVVLPKTTLEDMIVKHIFTPDSDIWTKSTLQLSWENIYRQVRIDRFNKVAAGAQQLLVSPEATHRTFAVREDNQFELTDTQKLSIGVDYWRWSYTGARYKAVQHPKLGRLSVWDDPLADSHESNLGVYAEYNWDFAEDWTLNLGGRVDRNWSSSDRLYTKNIVTKAKVLARKATDSDDWAWSTHAGLTWRFVDDWSMTLIGSRGYRAADIMDRYKYIQLNATANTATYGDPSLDPEISWYTEYGLHYTTDTVRANLALFYNQLHDLIEPKNYGAPVTIGGVNYYNARMTNVSRAVIEGVEFDGEWRLNEVFTAYGSVAWLDGKNKTEHTYLRYNPPVNGLLGVRAGFSNGFWSAVEADAAGGQRHTPPSVEHSRRWATLNLRAGYDFKLWGMDSSVTGSVTNIFNTDYVNYLSTTRNLAYEEPGRCFTLAFTTKF